jgi:hypothetical protein
MSDFIYREGATPVPAIRARQLHERSFLLFEYYGSNDEVTRAHLPFLQNINISEDGKANLANYNLLGRAGQLFAYNGADSRRLKLDFEMNLLHLFHLQETEGFSERMLKTIKNKDLMTERNRFLGKAGPPMPYNYAQGEKVKFLKSLGLTLPQAITLQENKEATIERHRTTVGSRANVDFYVVNDNNSDKNINLMMYWVNLVRSSVLNDSRNTVFGPPTVRLNHGPMYMNSPCLVEDYKITVDKTSNYDLETLLPHTLKVSMSLIESRAGDFGDYSRGDPLEGDNLTGWESILDENVLDSMNYDIEVFDDETFEGLN